MSTTPWRLLLTGTNNGPMNMAIDQAIMEAVAEDEVPPTLRFYAWEPACLSLGYMQPADDVALERLAQRGWDVVRRMTGGRAILHTDELTYSVAVKADDPVVEGDIVASYRRLSGALQAGLQHFGAQVSADRLTTAHAKPQGPVCFEVPSHYEITVNGKKLVGSAQVRKFGAVLQHGSLPLTGDIARICDALAFESDAVRERAKTRVHQRAATLEDALEQVVRWEDAAKVMARSFQGTFGLDYTTDTDLTRAELARAEALCVEQYATREWTHRF